MLGTNSETRVLGKFVDVLLIKIAQQLAEIFEPKEKSSVLTCKFKERLRPIFESLNAYISQTNDGTGIWSTPVES